MGGHGTVVARSQSVTVQSQLATVTRPESPNRRVAEARRALRPLRAVYPHVAHIARRGAHCRRAMWRKARLRC